MESAFNEIKNVYIYLYQKMDCTTDFYRSFGELLTKYAALSKVTYKEVSAELGISSKTYAKVWKGQVQNFSYYRALYAYIYHDLPNDKQRQQMDTHLQNLFHQV